MKNVVNFETKGFVKKVVLVFCIFSVFSLSGCKKEKSLDEMSDDERDRFFEERMEDLENNR